MDGVNMKITVEFTELEFESFCKWKRQEKWRQELAIEEVKNKQKVEASAGKCVSHLSGYSDINSLDRLELTARAGNCLQSAGIKTISELLGNTQINLLCAPKAGGKTVDEIIEQLQKLGLSLKPPG